MATSLARETALRILMEIENSGAYANLALKKILGQVDLQQHDKALVTELVYGAAKRRNTLDWALSRFLKRSLNSLPKAIYLILRLGAYQLIYLDRIPRAAAVNETVKLAKKYGHPGTVRLTNGVLRNLARNLPLEFPPPDDNSVQHLSLRFSHPEWLVEKWLNEFGFPEIERLLALNNHPPDIGIRVNTLKLGREELADRLRAEGLKVMESCWAPEGLLLQETAAIESLAGYRQGLFQVQSEGSMMISRVLAPRQATTVLDACAGPGGKTTHLAALMKDEGRILAWDVHPHRLELIEANCRRLGVTCVETYLQNAAQAPSEWYEIANFALVDAPCSGLGVLRRRPDARWRKLPSQLKELQRLQLEILEGVIKCLKPGGVMVYSTCSLAPEENQQVVNILLKRHEELQTEEFTSSLAQVPAGVEETVKAGMLQLLPQRDGLDGFFMARFRKS